MFLRAFSVMVAQSLPKFSSRMHAWATKVAGTWLIGEVEINDIAEGERQADSETPPLPWCVYFRLKLCNLMQNSNTIYFLQDMSLSLIMTPDYSNFDLQFSFGKMPNPAQGIQAKHTPYLTRCPIAGGLRKWHTNAQDNNWRHF
jgi:hypothetical protein